MSFFRLISATTLIVMSLSGKAQHFYYKLDVATNNIYSFAVSNLATAGLNALTNRMLFDNAYTYTYIRAIDSTDGMNIKNTNILGLKARDIFGDITAGGKLGYQSSSPGSFNWGVFGSAHYRVNQYKVEVQNGDFYRHNVQRLLLGGGLMFNIGDIESSTKIIIEAGVRYEMPIQYHGLNGMKASEMLNKGLSSHYAIRINGNGCLQGLGVFVDVPHYNLYKNYGYQYGTPNVRMYSFGIIYTITPWKIKDIY